MEIDRPEVPVVTCNVLRREEKKETKKEEIIQKTARHAMYV
jgi:1-aminocyclopropane-1-carboxylate deaminase/D-cysteine desulfhydrase-like pyridoxal-dependent ACC family enzyme